MAGKLRRSGGVVLYEWEELAGGASRQVAKVPAHVSLVAVASVVRRVTQPYLHAGLLAVVPLPRPALPEAADERPEAIPVDVDRWAETDHEDGIRLRGLDSLD